MIRLETCSAMSQAAVQGSRPVLRIERSGARTARPSSRAIRACRGAMLVSMGFLVGICSAGELKVDAANAALRDTGGVAASTPSRLRGVQTPSRQGMRVILVRQGDTVWGLAERYSPADHSLGDSVDSILRANGLRADATLQVGQRVLIPR